MSGTPKPVGRQSPYRQQRPGTAEARKAPRRSSLGFSLSSPRVPPRLSSPRPEPRVGEHAAAERESTGAGHNPRRGRASNIPSPRPRTAPSRRSSFGSSALPPPPPPPPPPPLPLTADGAARRAPCAKRQPQPRPRQPTAAAIACRKGRLGGATGLPPLPPEADLAGRGRRSVRCRAAQSPRRMKHGEQPRPEPPPWPPGAGFPGFLAALRTRYEPPSRSGPSLQCGREARPKSPILRPSTPRRPRQLSTRPASVPHSRRRAKAFPPLSARSPPAPRPPPPSPRLPQRAAPPITSSMPSRTASRPLPPPPEPLPPPCSRARRSPFFVSASARRLTHRPSP